MKPSLKDFEHSFYLFILCIIFIYLFIYVQGKCLNKKDNVLTHLKRPWWWGRLKMGEGDNRGWDGWMASPSLWTWVWASSRSWWWTGKPGVLQFMGSQRASNWTELNVLFCRHIVCYKSFLSCMFGANPGSTTLGRHQFEADNQQV